MGIVSGGRSRVARVLNSLCSCRSINIAMASKFFSELRRIAGELAGKSTRRCLIPCAHCSSQDFLGQACQQRNISKLRQASNPEAVNSITTKRITKSLGLHKRRISETGSLHFLSPATTPTQISNHQDGSSMGLFSLQGSRSSHTRLAPTLRIMSYHLTDNFHKRRYRGLNE